MKKELFALGGILFLLSMSACNSGTSTTSTDSTTVTTGSTQSESGNMSAATTTVHLDPAASYVDLRTGKQVKLRVDTVTKYVVEESSNQPIMYYINPSTNDTFDRSGRVVNNALIKGENGDYSIDESRITISSDNSSNVVNSDTNTNSAAPDEGSTTSGNSKTKIKDDKFKQKTDTSTIKVKEDKIKIKTKSNN